MKLVIPIQGQLRASLDFDEDNPFWGSVPTALAIAVQFLTGLPVSAATLKELVYGSDYNGITAPAAYINECARRGVKLWSAGGTGSVLIKVIRSHLVQHHPVIAPIVKNSGIPHHLLFSGMDEPAGTLSAIDPTTGKDITRIDAEWTSLLHIEVWIAETMKRTIIPAGWKDTGSTLIAPNGMTVRGRFRAFVLDSRNQWQPDNWPLEPQQHAPLNLFQRGKGSGTRQCFRFCLLGETIEQGVFMTYIGEALLSFEQALQAQATQDLKK